MIDEKHKFGVTDETRKVFAQNPQALAREYQCNPSYISHIISGDSKDPFAPFEKWFTAAVDAGLDVAPWITRLKIIMERKQQPSKEIRIGEATANFHREASDVTAAHIEDRPLDIQLREAEEAISAGLELKRKLMQKINEQEGPLYNGKAYDFQKRRGVS